MSDYKLKMNFSNNIDMNKLKNINGNSYSD